MTMTFDPSVNLGTVIGIVVMMGSLAVGWGSIRAQLVEIKERLGCTEESVEDQGEKTNTINARLSRAEADIAWLKEVKDR